MRWLIVYLMIILMLNITNGAFALSEIAIISSRKARLQQLAEEGDRGAVAALNLANHPDSFLPTVQIGVTLVGILTGAFGDATIAEKLSEYLRTVPALAGLSGPFATVVVVLGTTYLTLILGELVPKRVALYNPEKVATIVSRPMRLLARISSPIVFLLSVSSDAVIRLSGVRPSEGSPVTEEEIRLMIDQGAQVGLFEKEERDMVTSIFRLDERRVGTIMKPRTDMVWIDIGDSSEDIRRKIGECGHSRYPVCREDIDNVLGIVHARDLLTHCEVGPLNLETSLKTPLFVYENVSVFKLLKLFKKTGNYAALAVDEYGSVQGFITINDVMETIVGELPNFGEEADEPAVQREDGSWLLDGALSFEDFKDIFAIKVLPGESRGYYHTLAGFVMMHLGHIPRTGESFEWENLRFEVVDMDGHRVDKVLVLPIELDQRENDMLSNNGRE